MAHISIKVVADSDAGELLGADVGSSEEGELTGVKLGIS